ncbi:MAG: enoyl-CoA hydratase/isomerase family protein [Bacteroidota bacterium]
MYKSIIWKEEEGIGHLILNHPPTNLMTKAFFDELKDLVDNTLKKSCVDAIVIYGNGRHFSAGADLNDLLTYIKNNTKTDKEGNITGYPDFLIEHYRTFSFFEKTTIPVIAAIRGVCIGSALELALFCNIRLCGAGAILGLPETTFNLIPGCGGIQKLLSLTGQAKTMELILQGKTFSPEEAIKYNIIDKIVHKKDVIDIAIKLAKKMT